MVDILSPEKYMEMLESRRRAKVAIIYALLKDGNASQSVTAAQNKPVLAWRDGFLYPVKIKGYTGVLDG